MCSLSIFINSLVYFSISTGATYFYVDHKKTLSTRKVDGRYRQAIAMGGKRPGINCCIFYFSYVDINNLFLRSIHMRNLHIVIHQMAIKRRAASKPARKTSTLPFHTYIVSYGLSRPIVQPNQASDSDRRDEVPLNQLLIFLRRY